MKNKTIGALISLGAIWVTSFVIHPQFQSFKIGFINKGQVEVIPDFYVTYNCDSFERMKGLAMNPHGDKVTVNYGGLGRRRGFRNFKCK